MILTCPACRTNYRVEAQALRRPGGRMVRCASCGHTWREASPARQREPVMPAIDLPPMPGHGPRTAMRQHRRRRLRVGWVVLIALGLLLALAVWAGFAARGQVVAIWPSAARLYALVGLPVEQPATALKLGKITP